jgi:uncharacterized membrane protein
MVQLLSCYCAQMFFSSSARQVAPSANGEAEVVECCKLCGTPVTGTYYRVDIDLACDSCGRKIRGTHNSLFARAIGFGIAAAIGGFAIYAAVAMLTGWNLTVLSLLVGLMVGKAMMAGSRGRGERRYQIAAAVLTYAAVALATVPVSNSHVRKHRGDIEFRSGTASGLGLTEPSTALASNSSGETSSTSSTVQTVGAQLKQDSLVRLAVLLGGYVLVGLASPLVVLGHSPYQGFWMVLILLVALRIAWNTAEGNQKPVLYGPF